MLRAATCDGLGQGKCKIRERKRGALKERFRSDRIKDCLFFRKFNNQFQTCHWLILWKHSTRLHYRGTLYFWLCPTLRKNYLHLDSFDLTKSFFKFHQWFWGFLHKKLEPQMSFIFPANGDDDWFIFKIYLAFICCFQNPLSMLFAWLRKCTHRSP